jgi:hypothetical protein
MAKWEYLTVQLGAFGLASYKSAPQYVNGQELTDWKIVPLNVYLNQLGSEGWEMSGTTTLWFSDHSTPLFFKRSKS